MGYESTGSGQAAAPATDSGGWWRHVLAWVLIVVAALAACASAYAAYADRVATTSGPTTEVATALANDPALREALPAEISSRLLDRIPDRLPVPDRLQDRMQARLQETVGDVVDGILDDPGFQAALNETVDQSRASYVERVKAAAAAGSPDEVTFVLEAGPIASLVLERVHERTTALGFGGLLDTLGTDVNLPIDTGAPTAEDLPASTAAAGLKAAAAWPWYALLAAVAAGAALWLAGPRLRWAVLAVGGAVAALVGIVGVVLAGRLPGSVTTSGAVAAAVADAALNEASAQLSAVSWWIVAIGAVVAVGGATTAVVLARRHPTA
ncbi:hypothetical protein GCM10023081_07680 [Arthrobacter ginkgonis]|uniref:Integral membrane protein n=1 Tax=Arthrobacter ginkgonis TaxID=1630594 RepID=A0ABP7BYF9_9MICC